MSAVTELRAMRNQAESMFVDPDRVLQLAKPLIESGGLGSAGNEAWDIYEQAILAALEVSDDSFALLCLTRLSDRFPQSGRVHALRGMMLEVTQDPKEALKFYGGVLAVEPTNLPIIKRRITFTKSLGRVGEAIALLVAYLDTYYTDADAWAELGDLYLEIDQFDKAAFSWSEVILLKPHDYEVHARYAETIYAQAQQNNDVALFHVALKSFLRSIELCDDYVRGFCGVKICCDRLLSMPRQAVGSSEALVKRSDAQQTETKMLEAHKVKNLHLMSLKWLLKAQTQDDTIRTDARTLSFVQRLVSTDTEAVK